MNQTQQLADRFREVLLNGKWIANTNFFDQLSEVNLRQATKQIADLNTIAALTFHIDYYIAGVLNVLEGGTLDIRDKYSFELPPLKTEQAWQELLDTTWKNAERFAVAVENLPDAKLAEPFVDKKYGTYERNLSGMIEHCYYHLGQIVLIRKLVLKETNINPI